ncbi:putative dual specificity tyrosine-phosphorylation-regulated kinase 3-like protein, partial [Stegodyphus mimosarum]
MPLSRTKSLITNGTAISPSNESFLPQISSKNGSNMCLEKSDSISRYKQASKVFQNGVSDNSAQLPDVRPNSNGSNDQLSNKNSKPQKSLGASPQQVMKLYMHKLTPYEHHEIFSYPQVYFIGANAKKRLGVIGAPNNSGYDDEQGSYLHTPHDHIAYRYEMIKIIGKGSFGQVIKAYDHKCHQNVALKIVRNEKRFHRQAQEEIRILDHLRK